MGLSPNQGSSNSLRKSDCLGCAVLLCLVCLTLFASFFLPSHLSLKHVYIQFGVWCLGGFIPGLLLYAKLTISLFIRCTGRFGPSQLSCFGSSVVERSVKSVEYHGFESHPRQLIFLRKSDCLGCAVLLCLVCLFDLACFFLPSSSLKHVHVHVYMRCT